MLAEVAFRMKSLPHVFSVPVFQSKRSGIGFLLFSAQDPIIKETQLETYQLENKQLTQHLEGPSVPGMGGSRGGLCPCVPTIQACQYCHHLCNLLCVPPRSEMPLPGILYLSFHFFSL